MQNYNTALDLQNKEMDASGSAMERYGAYSKSTEAKINDLKNSMQQMWMGFINSDVINGAVSGITKLITTFGNVPTIIGLATTALLVFKGQALAGLITDLFAVTAGESAMSIATIGLTATFNTLKVAIMTNPLGALAVVLTTVAGAFMLVNNNAKQTSEQMKKDMSEVADNLKKASTEAGNLNKLLSEQQSLQSKDQTKLTVDEKSRLLDIERQLATALPDATTKYDEQNNALATNTEKTKEAIEAKKALALENAKTVVNSYNPDDEMTKIKETYDKKKELEDVFAIADAKKRQEKIDDIINNRATKGAYGLSVPQQYMLQFSSDDNKEKMLNDVLKDLNKNYHDGVKGMNDYNLAASAVNSEGKRQYEVKYNESLGIKANTKATEDNTGSKKDNTKALGDNNASVETAEQKQKRLQTTLVDSVDKVKDYSKYIKEMNENQGHLKSASVQDILKGHPELIQYLGDEKVLYQKIQEAIDNEKNTAKDSYKQMIEASNEFYTANIKNNTQVVNDFKDNYNIDLRNYANLAEAKSSIETQLINDLSKKWGAYFDATTKGFSQQAAQANDAGITTGIMTSMDNDPNFKKLQGVENYFNNIAGKFTTATVNSVFDKMADASEGDTKTSALEKAQKEAEDAQKKAQQAQEKALEGQIKKLQDEKKAYDQSVENAYKIEQQQEDAIIKGYQTQLDALKEKKQLQDDTNKEIEYQNQLIKDQQALQNAQNEKNVRMFKDGQWQWVADEQRIKQAQDSLDKSQKDFNQWKADQAEKKAEDELNAKIKQAEERKSAYATDYQNRKDATDQNYDAQIDVITNRKETLQGYYADGTDYVPKTGRYLVGEKGAEIITLPEGASVTPNNKIGQELNPTTNVATNPIVQSTKKTLDEVDDTVQKFVDNSPQYSKDMNKNIGNSTIEHKDLVKKPLDKLIDEITFEIQRFVNASGQYGENTDKNIGSGIANSSETVMNPTRTLITNVKELLNNFAISTIEYGKLMDTQLGQGIIDATPDLLDKTVKDLTTKVIDKFKEGFGIHSPSTVFHEIGGFLMQGLINGMNDADIEKFISDKVGGMTKGANGVNGATVGTPANVPGNVQDWIRQAMLATGVPDSWFNSLVSIAMHESGGDPNSINTYDSNAIAGHPSQGLMQTIPETFASNMLPGHNNILNPVDNAIAAIRYIIGRYGDVSNVPGIRAMARGGSYVGYQTGTESVPDTGLAMVGEQGAELRVLNQGDGIITSKRTRILNQIADMPNILSKLSSDSLLSKLSMPSNLFNMKTPDVNVIIPKGNMNSEPVENYHINIENIELASPDGESFVNSLVQLAHVTNNN